MSYATGVGTYSLYYFGQALKYDNRRLNVGIGTNPSINSRLYVCSSDSGESSNLWMSGCFGGLNKTLNKIALGTVNSNAVIGSIDINNNFSDLYLNNNSKNSYGNVFILGNLITSNNINSFGNIGIGKNASRIAKLDVNSYASTGDISYFSCSNLTYNKLVFKITNNSIPTINAVDSNFKYSPLLLNGDNNGNGNDVIIGTNLITNYNASIYGNIGFGTNANSNTRLIINGGNISILNNSQFNIGTSGTNNSLSVYGYGYYSSNVGIGTFPTINNILSIGSGTINIANNSFLSLGNSSLNNNGLIINGYGYFTSNIGIGGFVPNPNYVLAVASGTTIFNNNSIINIGFSTTATTTNILNIYGNFYTSGYVGLGTLPDGNNKLLISGNALINGTISATKFSGNGELLTNLNPNNFNTAMPNSISGTLINYDTTYFNVINGNKLSIITTAITNGLTTQWTSAGNLIYYTTSSGNPQVGIGTNQTTGKFQIGNGSTLRIAIGGVITNDYSMIGTTEDGNNTYIKLSGSTYTTNSLAGSIQYVTQSGSGHHLFYVTGNDTAAFTIAASTGNIGIGISPSSVAIAINDKLLIAGGITIINGNAMNVGISGNSSFLNVYGYVGIGTVAVNTASLTVNGGVVNFLNTSIINIGQSGSISNYLTIWGNIGIGSVAGPSFKLYCVGGPILFDNNTTFGIGTTTQNTTTSFNLFGTANLYNSVGIGTVATLGNTLNVNSGTTIFANGANVNIGSTTNSIPANILNIYGNNNVYGNSYLLGNVGIGTIVNNNYLLNIGRGTIFIADDSTLGIGTTTLGKTNIFYVNGGASIYGNIGIGVSYSDVRMNVASGTCKYANTTAIIVGESGNGSSITVYGTLGIGTAATAYVNGIVTINKGIINIFNGSTLNLGSSIDTQNPNIFNSYGTTNIFGNVGIGMSANLLNGFILSVAGGTTNFISPATINVGNTSTTDSRLNINGSLNVLTTTTISGNVGIGTVASTTSGNILSIVGSGITNFGVGSIINVGISGGANSTFNLYGNSTISGNASILGFVGIGTASGTDILTVRSGTTSFAENSIVKIGVTTQTGNALNVYGNITAFYNLGIGTAADISSSTRLQVAAGTSTFLNGCVLNVGQNASTNNNFLNIYGNVGIGTNSSSSASTKLVVAGGITNFSSISTINVGISGETVNTLNVYGTIYSASTIGIGTNPTTSRLTIASNSQGSSITLIEPASMLIGTQGNSSSLTVNGSISAIGTSYLKGNVGIGTDADTTAGNILTVQGSGISPVVNFKNPINVNIGTSGFTNSSLNIYGSSYISLNSQISGKLGIGTVVDSTYVLNTYGAIYFQSTAQQGYVGINTAPSTTSALNISGNIFIYNGNIGFNNGATLINLNSITTTTFYGNLSASYIRDILPIANGGTGSGTFEGNCILYYDSGNTKISSISSLTISPTGLTLSSGSLYVGSAIIANNGAITATNFIGSGSGLTNISMNNALGVLAVSNGGTGLANLSGNQLLYATNSSTIAMSGNNLTWDNTALTVTGNIKGTTFTGSGASITGLSATNISDGILGLSYGGTGVGGATPFTVNQLLYYNGTSITSISGLKWTLGSTNTLELIGNLTLTTGNIILGTTITINNTSGIITATSFTGNGANLTNINPDNFSTVVPISKGGTGLGGASPYTANSILYFGSSTSTFSSTGMTWTTISSVSTLTITGNVNCSSTGTGIGTFNNLILNNPLPISSGGTGVTSLAATYILIGGNTGISTVTNFTLGTSGGLTKFNIPCNVDIIGTLTITNPLNVIYGGTGLNTIASGAILFGGGGNTLSTSTNLTWTNGNTLTATNLNLTNPLSTAYGGTGATTYLASTVLGVNTTNNAYTSITIMTWNTSGITIAGSLQSTSLTVTNAISVASGGIGTNTLAANCLLIGNGNNNISTDANLIWTNKILTLTGTNAGITATGIISCSSLALSNALTISNGGIGTNTLQANCILIGNGTSAISTNSGFTFTNVNNTITFSIPGNISATGSITASGLAITSALTVANGGIGTNTLPANCILIGNGTNNINTNTNFTFTNVNNIITLNVPGNITATANITGAAGTFSSLSCSSCSGLLGLNANNITAGTLNAERLSYEPSQFGVTGGKLTLSAVSSPWTGTTTLVYTPSLPVIIGGSSLINSLNKLEITGGSIYINASSGTLIHAGTTGTTYFNFSTTSAFINVPYISIGTNTVNSSFALYVVGTIAATVQIGIASDERLKENIRNIDDPLEKIKKCRGVYFNRLNDSSNNIGVIAQEIEKILPEVVITDNEGYKSVLYQNITGILIEAIKEMDEKYNKLEDRLKLLEKRYI